MPPAQANADITSHLHDLKLPPQGEQARYRKLADLCKEAFPYPAGVTRSLHLDRARDILAFLLDHYAATAHTVDADHFVQWLKANIKAATIAHQRAWAEVMLIDISRAPTNLLADFRLTLGVCKLLNLPATEHDVVLGMIATKLGFALEATPA